CGSGFGAWCCGGRLGAVFRRPYRLPPGVAVQAPPGPSGSECPPQTGRPASEAPGLRQAPGRLAAPIGRRFLPPAAGTGSRGRRWRQAWWWHSWASLRMCIEFGGVGIAAQFLTRQIRRAVGLGPVLLNTGDGHAGIIQGRQGGFIGGRRLPPAVFGLLEELL